MKRTSFWYIYLSFCMVLAYSMLISACNSSENLTESVPEEPKDEKMEVSIITRTSEEEPASTLQAGLYMVNYHNGQSDELLEQNNYVNNQMLTWMDNVWMTAAPIYWNDMITPADFYAYAPYQYEVPNARAMIFSIQTDQTKQEDFSKSDLMWGTVSGQNPSSVSFDLFLSHQLSQLTVTISAGTGFDEDELRAEDVQVSIGGTRTTATVDLQTGVVSVLNSLPAEDIKCMNKGDLSYAAILLPQQVPFANLIQVDWKGNKYTLQNSFTLEAKKQYSLTVNLKKSKSGFDIGIVGWDIIGKDFGGVVGGN